MEKLIASEVEGGKRSPRSKFAQRLNFEEDLKIDTRRLETSSKQDVVQSPASSPMVSPTIMLNKSGVLLSPDRQKAYSQRSPARRPATPLKGIGKFLQHRRRDASPDSPSVRADLLSGSVVAGFVATAIQEVEANVPHPEKNKQLADLVERAVRAEFKANQIEAQKNQVWNLVSIAEDEADVERQNTFTILIIVLIILGVDALALLFTSLANHADQQKLVGTILATHVTTAIPAVLMLRRFLFVPSSEDNTEETPAFASEPSVSGEKSPTKLFPSKPKASPVTVDSRREASALSELKETFALLPADQKGLAWLQNADDGLLLRFLRGHSYGVSKAFKYLVKSAEWREDYGTNNLLDSWAATSTRSATLIKSTFPISLVATTNGGQRVYLFRLATCDLPGYFRSCAAEDIVRNTVFEFERHSLESNHTPGILIVDLGVNDDDPHSAIKSVGQMRAWIAGLMQYMSAVTKLCDPFFPETFAEVFFVRTPMPFWPTWRVAQLLIPVGTRSKIKIFNNQETAVNLKAKLDDKCIPDFLGGSADTSRAPHGGLLVVSAAVRAVNE